MKIFNSRVHASKNKSLFLYRQKNKFNFTGKKFRGTFYFILILTAFFGTSVTLTNGSKKTGEVSVNLTALSPLIQVLESKNSKQENLFQDRAGYRVVLSGQKELNALNADHWFFVRQSATWANSNSNVI
ncbi:MAG: hypothetical protein OEZ34_17065, partial [Spirochaetia bacterium]|nr:hypothetical protein [Spirochaetia bacterium]